MKFIRSKEYRCIQGDSAESFEAAINKVLTAYPNAEMHIDGLIPFLCHAWIKVERYIPETIAEEHEIDDDIHYCIECPHLERPRNSNKNQKTFPCRHARHGMSMTDSHCCDVFYEWFEREKVNEND